jgi:hypothetical protein
MNAPQPQHVAPKQITYNGAVIDVHPQPGGVILAIAVPACGEVHIFPMSAEVAKFIGDKLSAPHIQVAPAGAVNGNGKPH